MMEPSPRLSGGSDPIRVDSVADLAYERIRGYVLGGEVPPGARLGQVELAERFGISRTPVREALRRLAGEGLVDFHSNRGFRVADLGLDAVLRRMEVSAIWSQASRRWPRSAERGEDLDLMRRPSRTRRRPAMESQRTMRAEDSTSRSRGPRATKSSCG